MKIIFKIVFIFYCLILVIFNLQAQQRTKKIDKKINKAIEKLWADKTIEQAPLATDVSYEFELFFEDNQLYQMNNEEKILGFMLLRRGYGCQVGGCDTGSYAEGATCSADGATYETFDYVVFFNTNLEVLKMIVVNYPGDYGYEICGKNWLKQFIGFKGQELVYTSDIDAISGATISASSITSDIQEVHKHLSQLLAFQDKILVAGEAASSNKK